MRHGEPKAYFEKARANVDKALDLDETLVEAKLIDGALQFFFEWNWEEADRILEEVLKLDSSLVETHSCYLHSHDARGHIDESLLAVRSALMRQPDSFAIRSELGCASYYAHEFENSLDAYHDVLKDDPNNYKTYWGLGRAYGQLHRYDQAIAALETGLEKGGGQWSVLLSELAHAYASNGEEDKARRILDELKRRENEEHEFVDPYVYAIIYVGLNDNDKVFRQLQRAYEIKSPALPSMNTEPKLAHLRDDPRFQEMIRRLRFQDWRRARAPGND
jgi:tetratricopeptide (TPR) repeat protein